METWKPRGVGIDFRAWQVMVTLFDDDPKQVASFNAVAERQGISGLGVVRVRRQGTKRSGRETSSPGRRTAEIRPSDTYLDSALYTAAINELSARGIEDFLLAQTQTYGADALSNPHTTNLIAAMANYRNTDPRAARDQLLAKSGLKPVGVFPSDNPDVDVRIWRKKK